LGSEQYRGKTHGRFLVMSRAAATEPPVIIDIAARFRLPSRRAARRVADRVACDHRDARVTVSPTRLLHRGGEWSVYVRLPQNRFGLERIRQVTDGFAELAEEFGGEMVWEATRPQRAERADATGG
jgi:hypothetical protein